MQETGKARRRQKPDSWDTADRLVEEETKTRQPRYRSQVKCGDKNQAIGIQQTGKLKRRQKPGS